MVDPSKIDDSWVRTAFLRDGEAVRTRLLDKKMMLWDDCRWLRAIQIATDDPGVERDMEICIKQAELRQLEIDDLLAAQKEPK